MQEDLVINQGSNFAVEILITDIDNVPINLTGYTFTSSMEKPASNVAKVNFTVTADANAGIVTLALGANTTANIEATRWIYDVKASANSVVSCLIRGTVTVNEGVT